MVKKTERMETYLQRIVDAIEKIKTHLGKVSVQGVEKHPVILDACLMQLFHIGETANKIKRKYPECSIDLGGAIKLRNFATHDYMGVNSNVVKNVINNNLPGLKKAIVNYLKK